MLHKNIKTKFNNLKLNPDDKVVVAVSGGVDSVVLLDLALRNLKPTQIIVTHVNHGIRLASAREAKFVQSLAKEQNLLFETTKLRLKAGSEEEARKGRYEFLQQVAHKHGAKKILTAHHLNDQAETLLLKLTRGAGPLNIWGMQEKNGIIWRPLLNTTKDEIHQWAKDHNLKHVTDKSNNNSKYARNRIRNKVIPELQKINPQVVQTISANIDLGQELTRYLEKELATVQKKYIKGGAINIKDLLGLDPFIQKALVWSALKKLTGSTEVYPQNVKAVLDLTNTKGSKKTEIAGFTILKNYDKIVFGHKEKLGVKSAVLKQNKSTKFNQFTFHVSEVKKQSTSKNCLYLTKNQLQETLIRTWKPGDKIKTKVGTQKLQDIFVNNKVPKEDRRSWPVVTIKSEVIWVPLLAKNNLLTKNTNLQRIEVKIEKN